MISLATQRYIVMGLLNTLLGYGIIVAAMVFGGLSPPWANASGYAVGLVVAFFAYKHWVFIGSHRPWWRQIHLFLLSFLFSYGGNMVVLMVCLYVLYVNPYMAQMIAMMTYTVLFYLINRHVVFAVKHHG
ncbi:MAG: GtrA family protein [Alphaproteobacteria bacterium GM7ARS4]|nr:GtrA family protein [Alphaproteobacteria bacterium GM7ARS4]